ncbi:TPA: DUF134 domain-containing protein [Vibrio vulnificus]|nr:DUF134 domain-containing protein [Vibrio vulnificus]
MLIINLQCRGHIEEAPMPRPKKPRTIGCLPKASCFKPNGIPAHNLPRIALEADELEALRLADVLQLHQLEAAQSMGVSRQTFGNIIKRARNKVALCLVEGKVLTLPNQSQDKEKEA